MQRDTPNMDKLRQRTREADIHLAQHERLIRIVLGLLVVLNVVVLALVMSRLWDHPWTQESLRSGIL